MYGRLIVCTRVPACKSSALATALPNPGQEARLHYTRCGQGPVSPGMSHAIRSIHSIGEENVGKMEEGEFFFHVYTQTHFRNPFIYGIRERNALAMDYVGFYKWIYEEANTWIFLKLSSFRLKIIQLWEIF